jgi:hypothetical protein
MAISIPHGAACYFCLGEEGDEEGKPLVRDCSCRGNSGFAHFSCLAKYAEQKCRAAVDMASFREPWHKCNNCKQPFQNQLSIDLASAYVIFAKETYGHDGNNKWDKMKVIDSLQFKIYVLNKLPNADVDDEKDLIDQLLDTVTQTKQDLNMNRWVHMPKGSEEYQYYKGLCGNYEAYAHKQLGGMFLRDNSEEGFKAMMQYLKKARAIYNLVDMKGDVLEVDTLISIKAAIKQAANDGMSSSTINCTLQEARNTYKRSINDFGMNAEATIKLGLHYANALHIVKHCIEAERLVTKLYTISRRVHGPDHKVTIEAVKMLEECNKRRVLMYPEDGLFQALRYENDGEICVVKGPITEPRNKVNERIYHTANKFVIPKTGCPVICHGLVSSSHLNGELGEVRNVKRDVTGIRLAVHFEKKGVRSALVKPANLRIVFELPSK